MPEENNQDIIEKVIEGPREDIKEAISFFKKTHSSIILFILITFLAAAFSCTLIVIFNHFHDWFIYLAYSVIAFGILTLHLISSRKHGIILSMVSLLLSLFVIIFFMVILIDKIPSQKSLMSDKVILRERLNSFYIPAAFFSLTCLGLIIQFILKLINQSIHNTQFRDE